MIIRANIAPAMETSIQRAAQSLFEAAILKKACDPVREFIGSSDVDAAYQVQKINIDKRLQAGERITGKKIGLTSFAVQKQLGVDQPDYGILFKSMEVDSTGVLAFDSLMQPKAEAEIAFVMGKDLDQEATMEDLIHAIDYAVAAIEIVGSRVADWNIRITDTIADNASASHYILGNVHKSIEEIDLEHCKMRMSRNGKIASEGSGTACMGNPLNAALWLANMMVKQGNPLRKGEILLSGALGPMVPMEKGDTFEASIEGLGSVQLTIS